MAAVEGGIAMTVQQVLPPADIKAVEANDKQFVPADDEASALATTKAVLAIGTIADDAMFDRACEALKGVKALRKRIEDHYKLLKDPLNRLRNVVLQLEHKDLDPVAAVEKQLGVKVADYQLAKERAAEVERQRLQAEEDERARQEQLQAAAALERVAAQEADPAMQQAIQQEAIAVRTAPVVAATVAAPAVYRPTGLSTRVYYSASVTDLVALAKAVGSKKVSTDALMGLTKDKATGIISSPWLNTEAEQRKATLRIPGVVVRTSNSMAGRGR